MLGTCLDRVRETTPLVHNITNYVTVNDVANVLLACGGSPIMSDDIQDVEDITSICGGLNINIGTLNQNTIPSMFAAGKKANELGHPVVLDPVGAGASALRTQTALKLLEDGTMPAGINQLRVGEGVLFGEDTTGSRFLEGCHHDAFTFRAQVVELRRKPSVPIGEHGRDGKGDTPEYPDRGVRLRAICAAGKQDVAWAALTPTLPGAEMIGASSDHLIVDVEDCGGQVRVGDWMEFRCGYMAVLDATTSAYVDIVVK